MVSFRLYLDSRRSGNDSPAPIRVIISKAGKSAMFSLGISVSPSNWQNGSIIDKKELKSIKRFVDIKKADIERSILELSTSGKFNGCSAKECSLAIQEYLDPSLKEQHLSQKRLEEQKRNSLIMNFNRTINNKSCDGTKGLYTYTLKQIIKYCDYAGFDWQSLTFSDVNKAWLEEFESYCLKTERHNTVAIHLRNIRAVFNDAIDEEITTCYPFRKFKIQKEESRDKSYSSKELKALFNYKCYEGCEQEAVDMFKLMFCLIGINCIDLAYLVNYRKDRIEYYRAKTHKFYSIKIEDEAYEIISKYNGKKYLLNILDRCPNYKTYFHRISKSLRSVGKTRIPGKKSIGKPILPDICLGSARTSWATIAQEELDIPREVIAAALGHHTIDVTTTYLRTDWRKKVDEANRKVLDLIFK